MLVYHVFATNLCEPAEAESLFKALAFVPENMSERYLRQRWASVGFHILNKKRLDSEWREAEIEVRDNTLLNQLLYLALRNIAKKWTMSHDWKAALNRFAIVYENRLPGE